MLMLIVKLMFVVQVIIQNCVAITILYIYFS